MSLHSFGHASTDSKNECFPDFWIEIRCFARISIVTKIKDGAFVALLVASSKYGENIHLSKVGYLWCLGGNKYMGKIYFPRIFATLGGHAPIDSKNKYFPGFWMEIPCFTKVSIVAKSRDGGLSGWW